VKNNHQNRRAKFRIDKLNSARLKPWLAASLILLTVFNTHWGHAYIEVPYSMGRIVKESIGIVVMRVEKVDREKNFVIYKKVLDLKGTHPTDLIKHTIGRAGFHPREWQTIMETAEPGKMAVFFHNGSASETCIDNYWYQCYPGGEWWSMSHAEPYMLRTFAGKTEKLIAQLPALIAGKEVILPCMVDGDKMALQLRTAKIQRLKASLAKMDYNPRRDFAGWGGDEYRQLLGMPGFQQLGTLGRFDPGAGGVVTADVDGDGKPDLCIYGEEKITLLHNAGNAMEEVTLPISGGARSAMFGDYNGDGKPDLLVATATGPKLLLNTGNAYKDVSTLLPEEPYYNLHAAAFIDYDGNGKLDILLANGFMGLRLYQNPGRERVNSADSKSENFEDVSDKVSLGISGAGSKVKGDRIVVVDVNGDGRQDFLYCAGTGLLLINTPTGFVEQVDSGIQLKAGGVMPAFGDFNGDKSLDLFVPQSRGCRLYRNDGKGHFTDVTAQSGDLAKFTGEATCAAFCDFNNQGRMDLVIGCIRGSNRYFKNNGNGVFTDAGDEIGMYQKVFNTRGLAVTDLNKDGVLDLAMTNEGQESTVVIGARSRVPVKQ
jgi:hypothetical protein